MLGIHGSEHSYASGEQKVNTGIKRPAGLIAAVKPPPSKTKKPVIGTSRATGISALEKRKRRANIRFAFRARPVPSCTETLLGRGFPTECITCTKLAITHPDDYSSFLVVAEVDNPRSLLDGQLRPENIFVRWYRPAINKDDCESQERVAQPSNL